MYMCLQVHLSNKIFTINLLRNKSLLGLNNLFVFDGILLKFNRYEHRTDIAQGDFRLYQDN